MPNQYSAKFVELVSKNIDEQIFELGDEWTSVPRLSSRFKDYLKAQSVGTDELNAVQSYDFLQKEGKTRTGAELRSELLDIDLDCNNLLSITEILLLLHKKMILTAYYKRKNQTPKFDLNADGIGIVGVGEELLDELFTLPIGLDPALEKAIADFMGRKKAREDHISSLKVKSTLEGVKGLTAGNELAQLESQDVSWLNREELTLNAARKKSSQGSGDVALNAARERQEAEKKAKEEASRNKLKSMASMFEQK